MPELLLSGASRELRATSLGFRVPAPRTVVKTRTTEIRTERVEVQDPQTGQVRVMGRSMRFRRTFGRRSSRRGAPPSRAPTRRSRSRMPLSERGPMTTWWPSLPSSIVAGAQEGSDDGSWSARPGPGRLHGRGHSRGSASRTHWQI